MSTTSMYPQVTNDTNSGYVTIHGGSKVPNDFPCEKVLEWLLDNISSTTIVV